MEHEGVIIKTDCSFVFSGHFSIRNPLQCETFEKIIFQKHLTAYFNWKLQMAKSEKERERENQRNNDLNFRCRNIDLF